MELNCLEKNYVVALLKVDIENEQEILKLWLKEKNYSMIQFSLNEIFRAKNIIKKLDE